MDKRGAIAFIREPECWAVGFRDVDANGMWRRVFGPASKAECQVAYLRLSRIYGPTTAVLGPVNCSR